MEQTEIRQRIEDLVRRNEPILGSRLVSLLKDWLPSQHWPPSGRSGGWRELILATAPAVAVVGRQGADVLYGTESTTTEKDERFWSAWASPTSRHAIHVGTDGTLDVVPLSRASDSALTPLPETKHRAIALEFVEANQHLDVEELRRAATLPEGTWWSEWTRIVRAQHKVNGLWLKFRMSRLVELLRSDLAALGQPAGAQEAAFDAIMASRDAASLKVREIKAAPRNTMNSGTSRHAASATVPNLRALLLRAVEVADEQTLREIRLPVGLVYNLLVGRD